MRSSLMLTSALVSFTRKADDETGSDKVIDKVVYLKPEDTLKDVVLHISNVADATLRLVAGMVVHATVRAYSPVIADRAKWADVQEEIMVTIKDHAAMKRGYDFKRAWTYKLVSMAKRICASLMTDYDRKGVQDGSPLQMILRARTCDKAAELVVSFIKGKTKSEISFAALEKAYNPPVTNSGTGPQAGKAAGKRGATGKSGNATKPETVAAQLSGDKGTAAINAIEAKTPKARATVVANKIASANIDHYTMAARMVAMINEPDKLIELAQLCTDRAKKLASEHKAAKPVKSPSVVPEKAAAQAG